MRRSFSKPNRMQLRVMLDYMGVPFTQQPAKVVDAQKMLDLARVESPDKFKAIRDVVMLGIDPKVSVSEDPNLHDAKRIIEIVDEHFADKVNKATNELDRKMTSTMTELQKTAFDIASAAIAEAAKKYQIIKVKVGNRAPVAVEGVLPEWFPKMLQLAQARKNILLVGPSGCGKTHVAAMLAKSIELPFSSQSCSAGMSESVLTGWLLPTGDNAKFIYTMAEFVRIYENGGVFLFDELDASDPNVLLYINQALAQDEFYLPIRYSKPLVKKHKNFIAVGATNTFGNGADAMYHARNAIDAATMDRFRIGVIPVDYSPVVEEKIVDGEILEWGRHVRHKIDTNRLLKVMSTRFLKDATDMKQEQDWSMDEIKSTYFADWSPEERRIMGELI